MKRSRYLDPDENVIPKKRALESKNVGEGHPFSFPFHPYETQLKLMSDLYDIFQSKSVGILESPTGTGKTLSSLCAVLTFLEDEQRKTQEEVQNNRKKASTLLDEASGLEFDGAMIKHHEAMEFTKLADTESEKLEYVAKKVSEARRRFDHYQTTQEVEIEDCVPRSPEEIKEQSPELLKVVYATRTHSQIDQLTKELERTRFSHRVVSLGSRNILCPNSEVNKLPNSVAGDKCRDLRETNKCPFYNRSKVRLLTDFILSDSVRNHQEILRESHCLKSCGYYASREAAPFCEVIFVPYATLMDVEMRKSVGLSIDEKTIVIIDEAHNLFSTLTDMSSSVITLTELSRGLEILKKFLNCKSERMKSIDFKNLKLFENAIEKAKTMLEGPYFVKKEKKNFEVFEFMMDLFNADGYRFIQAIEAAKKANLLSRIQSFCRSKEYISENSVKNEKPEESKSSLMNFLEKTKRKLQEEKQKSTSTKTDGDIASLQVPVTPESFPLFHLAEFAIALGSAGSNFQVIVDVVSNPRKYHLLCLNGGERFESIVTKARSTVLIGGTMRPAELVISLLTKDCKVPREKIIDNTYGHIIDSTNLRIATVAGDKIGPLTFTHSTMKDRSIWSRILDSLRTLCDIPNGLVVFFPSKAFMNAFLAVIKQDKGPNFEALMSRNLFIEGEADSWEKYSAKAKNQKATFFAIVGGKFSEGVNFSDELARCVVIVGLPYPNTMNSEFKAKVDYLKSHFEDESIGSKLPVNICMTQVNQAIGRIVRHKNDYGIVVLLDSRYSEPRHSDLIKKSRSVWVEQGLVRGKIYKIGQKQVQIFRGIPYAEPPVGELRFAKPVKKARWDREYTAIDYGAPCLQFMDFHRYDNYSGPNMQAESENCLFLNIFSPYDSEDESRLHPILVWIHGGSFLAGSADTGIDMETVARNFVFKGVTLITINYRLGPLGFMSINRDGKVEGNFGIWDMKLALEWVQRNIKQFNGDPNRVTIMGESAGAAAVSILAISPLTQGLVHQAIAMSGSSTSGWAIHRYGSPHWDMENVASYLTCEKVINTEDITQILNREPMFERTKKREHCNLQESVPECLFEEASKSPEKMLECFRKEVNFSAPLFRRALAVELGVSKMVVDNELITANGLEMIQDLARVPLLTGVAKREWAHKKPEFYQFVKFENLSRSQVEESVRKVIENAFIARLSTKVTNTTVDLISNATFLRYMEGSGFSYSMPEVVKRLQNLEADIEFVSPCQREIDAYVANGVPVYVYSFDYMPRGPLIEEEHWYYTLFGDTPVTVKRVAQGSARDGPFHGLDHAFIFTEGYSSNFRIDPFSKREKLMSKMLTKMIVNFVSKGDPSIEHFSWPVYSNESTNYVSLDLPPRVVPGSLHFPAPNFWNKEAEMLAKYVKIDTDRAEQEITELTAEERIQLAAYERAWKALWLLVIVIVVVSWIFVIYCVCHVGKKAPAKPYDNIVINR